MSSRLLSIVWRIILCSSLLAGVLVAPAPVARAATLIVTNNADSGTGSLRNAIAAASNGDLITFDNDYTITLASQLEIINKAVTITGAGHHITISGNNAVRVFYVGDGIHQSGNLTLDHLNIVHGAHKGSECAGQAVSCGGGLMLEYLTTATVSNCTFSDNDGGIQGGAIYSYYGNPLTVTNSTFVNNHALAYAGAIHVFYGSATLTNNTFTGNATTNIGSGYGGAILSNWGTVTFRNNFFANNSSPDGGNCNNSAGTFNDGGGNLVWGDTAYCPGANANPLLGTLGDYGGNTPTVPLLPGSAAINATSTNCPTVDARGISRSATCDSGAFESQGFTLTKTGGDNQSTAINTAFSNPLTLSVTSAFSEPVDGGVVTFTAPSSGASAAISGGPATISGGAVSVSATANGIVGGPYNVTASAAGASSSVNFSLTNLGASTTTSLTSSPNPSVFGQAVTFTATVTAASGVPMGTVTFYDNALSFGSGTLTAGGVATLTTTSLTIGTHSPITAIYSGSTNYNSSTSSNYAQTVNKIDTTTSLTSVPNPSAFGQAVTFTATVTSASGTPTGTVTVYDNGLSLGSGTLNASGVATLTMSSLTVGTHSPITATYSGSTNYNASTSSLLSQQVNKAAATITLGSLAQTYTGAQKPITTTTSPLGLSVIITYTGVSGTVYGPSQTAPTNAGTYSVTATVNDANYQGATASALMIAKADTLTTLTSAPNPATLGQAIIFTATLTTIAPGGGTPSGSITFTLASLSVSVPLDGNGQAIYLTNTLPVGTYAITAQYSGAANFNASSSSLNGGQVVTDTTITGLTALNSSPTRLRNTTYFTATATGSNITYHWNFGDGQSGSGATTGHIYTATGTYSATVTATNGAGSIPATTLVTIEPIKVYLPLVLNRY